MFNNRNSLTEDSLGVPVIAIGIPTVVDAATIVNDAIGHLTQDSSELHNILCDMNNMYVTAKDIDSTIKRLGFTLSEALNLAFNMCEA